MNGVVCVVKLNGKLQAGIVFIVMGILVLWVGGLGSWGLCAVLSLVGVVFLILGFMEVQEEKARPKPLKRGRRR